MERSSRLGRGLDLLRRPGGRGRSARPASSSAPGQAGLDFGCSSGRVVRVLAAAYPEMEWHGCDPLAEAIEWAQANLPGIAFERSPEHPPLPYADESLRLRVRDLDLVATSPKAPRSTGCAEMRRVIRPGGRLVLTTHGAQSIAHASAHGRAARPSSSRRSSDALYEHGFWFVDEFGEAGDHGLANPEWGTAFFTPRVALAKHDAATGASAPSTRAASRTTRTSTCSSRG